MSHGVRGNAAFAGRKILPQSGSAGNDMRARRASAQVLVILLPVRLDSQRQGSMRQTARKCHGNAVCARDSAQRPRQRLRAMPI